MSTSTSTLLEVVNRVLLNTNERPLANTTPLIGQQVKECIRQALHVLSRTGEWTWNQGKINADSWSAQVATLASTVQRIKAVHWDNDEGQLLPIKFIDQYQFDQLLLNPYTDNTDRALYWTIRDQNIAHVNPYPNSAGERIKIWFYVNNRLVLPSADANTFSMPEDFTNLLVIGATAMFIKRHSEDVNLARSFEDEFALELNQARARQTLIPQNSWNLYRGRKASSYDFA